MCSPPSLSNGFRSPPRCSVSHPPTNPVMAAAPTLNKAKGQPRNAADTKMESTPVCGVEIKKPTDAASDAPSRLSPSPAGITPQEHRGRGTPSATALVMLPRPVRCRRTKSWGSITWISPLTAAPTSSHGASSSSTAQRFRTKAITPGLQIGHSGQIRP